MTAEYWPHQFTKDGPETQIGEEQMLDNLTRPIMAQHMVCVHCTTGFIRNKDPQPTGSCPARSTKREMRRIKNG